jgi:hypothetical protein
MNNTPLTGTVRGSAIELDGPSGFLEGQRVAVQVQAYVHPQASGESFYEAATRLGLIGCVRGGPPDLSTNPMHMEGFGASES